MQWIVKPASKCNVHLSVKHAAYLFGNVTYLPLNRSGEDSRDGEENTPKGTQLKLQQIT